MKKNRSADASLSIPTMSFILPPPVKPGVAAVEVDGAGKRLGALSGNRELETEGHSLADLLKLRRALVY